MSSCQSCVNRAGVAHGFLLGFSVTRPRAPGGLHFANAAKVFIFVGSLTLYRGANLANDHRDMLHLATYNKRPWRTPLFQKRLFVAAEDWLALDKVVAPVTLPAGDFEESSVEIIGEKAWGGAKINHLCIKFFRLDGKSARPPKIRGEPWVKKKS
jgi:hypothetical protein